MHDWECSRMTVGAGWIVKRQANDMLVTGALPCTVCLRLFCLLCLSLPPLIEV